MSTESLKHGNTYREYVFNKPIKHANHNDESLLDQTIDYLYDNVFTTTGAFAAGAAVSSAYALKQAANYRIYTQGMQNTFASRVVLLRVPASVISKAVLTAKVGAVAGAFVAGFCIGTLLNKGFTWLNDGVTLGEQLYIWTHSEEFSDEVKI